ncbi:LysR family transcriptional regulator [Vibrio astriarenae]|uniref:LysR family transcriptional regulator n=1 Tax=Vibrio astriarenae TaxID=1481923 RepID=A0A7Z2YG38_9VIBR|nr:LysR family transcriptional regulator [Vibrio astriarenae]QIA66091.1 LysR family transcriptional regulator [Vibrio astriarenae]
MISNLDNFDLNLLSVVRTLVKYKSTKATALHLGISQASVSRNVRKINDVFGQNVFTRSAHGMEPSALAQKLASAADEMLVPLQLALGEFTEFDPASYDRSISIVIDPFILEEQAERLTKACSQAFPHSKLIFSTWDAQSIQAMKLGEFDYCITDQTVSLPQTIYQEKLYDEPNVIIARKHHPVLSHDHQLEDLLSLPMVSIPAPGLASDNTDYLDLYIDNGLEPNIVFETTNLRTASAYLSSSDAIMFGSPATAKNFTDLDIYTPSNISSNSSYQIYGGFLQSKRNHPLTQCINTMLKNEFKGKAMLFQ